jgi:hypothetical protein
MNFQLSPALRSQLKGQYPNKALGFDGAAIKIGTETLERWKAAYRNIRDWPAALQAIDDYCAGNPTDNPRQISRASAWLERRNNERASQALTEAELAGRAW